MTGPFEPDSLSVICGDVTVKDVIARRVEVDSVSVVRGPVASEDIVAGIVEPNSIQVVAYDVTAYVAAACVGG